MRQQSKQDGQRFQFDERLRAWTLGGVIVANDSPIEVFMFGAGWCGARVTFGELPTFHLPDGERLCSARPWARFPVEAA